jgi:SAM-dependent methyltransferase
MTAGPVPPDISAIYDRMRASEMNQWVGGADPEEVGDICAEILAQHVPFDPDARMLDFGCGIGRVMLAVLKQQPEARITGFDIVPRMIAFCEETIGAAFPAVRFELLEGSNDHYEKFKDAAQPRSRAETSASYEAAFDAVYAFSVFTHIDKDDFPDLLKFVSGLLAPGGRFLFTAFILTPFSRATINLCWTLPELSKGVYEDGDEVFIAQAEDRLAFIAYDMERIERMIWTAGLIPCVVEYGNWRGGGLSDSYQDVIVCRKPRALDVDPLSSAPGPDPSGEV